MNFGSSAGGTSSVDIIGIVNSVASAANGGSADELIENLSTNATFDGQFRGATAYSGDMRNLMGGIAGNSGPITLVVSGLTTGQEYLFQGCREAENTSQIMQVTFEDTDIQGGIDGGTPSPASNDDLGVLISYTYTATYADLSASLVKTSGVDNV